MEEGPFIVLTLDLEQTAILNAAIAHYWIHVRQSTDPELRRFAPQIADLQRHLVDKVRDLRKGEKLHVAH
jgi:hypothetical protein